MLRVIDPNTEVPDFPIHRIRYHILLQVKILTPRNIFILLKYMHFLLT